MLENRFDTYYDIRRANTDEIPDIMSFIHCYWKENHILSQNRAFFEYEMMSEDLVNFIVAKVKTSGELDGILGYLPCSSDAERLDTWGVIWKTRDEALPMLGIEMKKRFQTIVGARSDLGVGANISTSVPLLCRIMHYYTARMKHYYRLADKDGYVIALVEHKDIPSVTENGETVIVSLPTAESLLSFFDFSTIENDLPYKDFWYFKKRFYCHPIYKYEIWGVDDGEKKAFIVTRELEYKGSHAISIVDYAGPDEVFSECALFFDKLIREHDYEYIDVYFDGFDEEAVKMAGFIELKDDDTNIIPVYFNPFVLKNIDIYVDASNRNSRYRFFKADGDQDRPN